MPVEEKTGRSLAPTDLLREERSWCVRANTASQVEWYIVESPTVVDGVETSVDVFGCTDFCGSSSVDKGGSAVSCVGTNANGTSPLVSVNLDVSVEQFLDGSSTTFDPSLFVSGSEVLRGLDDGDVGGPKFLVGL